MRESERQTDRQTDRQKDREKRERGEIERGLYKRKNQRQSDFINREIDRGI